MKLKPDYRSIKFKTWLYFILFAGFLMLLLWLLQVLFLNSFYATMKGEQTKNVAKSIELIKRMLNAALTPIKSPAMFQHLPTKPVDDTLGSQVIALMFHPLETDNECEFLRSDPDFQALMGEYRKRFPQKEGMS